MKAVLGTTIAISCVFTFSCSSSLVKRQGTLISSLQHKSQILEKEVGSLRERLLVLEGSLRPTAPAFPARKKGVTRKTLPRGPGPEDLPTVRLAPRKQAEKSPEETVPEANSSSTVKKHRRRYRHKGTPGRRVVLTLKGSPRYRGVMETSTGRNSKILPLGKHYDIREPGGGTAPSAGHTSSDKKLYREAMEHFKRHQLAVAMIWFGKLIKQYPGSSLKGNALFWQGECYYGMKKYSLAMARYQEVLKKFSTHAKAPDALFKMAMSRLRSGSKKSGRTLLARVLELYPNSAVASKASRELERTRD